MLLGKGHYKEICECIDRNFDDPHQFQIEMKDIAIQIFKVTIYDIHEVYSFGETLFAMVHIDGISVTFDD